MKKLIYLFIIAILVNGCATASVTRYPSLYYPPTDPKNVAVYTNFPPAQYETIGKIEGSGAPAATWDSVAMEMRKKAAEIGGDAVVILVQDTPFVGTFNTPGSIRGNTTGYSNSSGNINAYGYGNNVYGSYRGSGTYRSTSNYTYTPPTSTPMYGKYARGVVVKYKSEVSSTSYDELSPPYGGYLTEAYQEQQKSWQAKQGKTLLKQDE
jgi:hypothetical protein